MIENEKEKKCITSNMKISSLERRRESLLDDSSSKISLIMLNK